MSFTADKRRVYYCQRLLQLDPNSGTVPILQSNISYRQCDPTNITDIADMIVCKSTYQTHRLEMQTEGVIICIIEYKG